MDEMITRLKIIEKKCIKEYKQAIGHEPKYISITFNNRKRYWGMCKHKIDGDYIELSKRLFLGKDEDVCQTLLHEFIHTEKDAHNHKAPFKKYAKKINDMFGYNISRCSAYPDITEKLNKLPKQQIKKLVYVVECPQCNLHWKRFKMTSLIKNPQFYRCPKCHISIVRKPNEYIFIEK